MSLIKCRECGHGVSNTADTCPNCGYHLKRRWYEVGEFTTMLVIGLALIFAMVYITKP